MPFGEIYAFNFSRLVMDMSRPLNDNLSTIGMLRARIPAETGYKRRAGSPRIR